MGEYAIHSGDCREILPDVDLVQAVVTDPPYELGFMGKDWDQAGVAFQVDTWTAVFNAMKPGAHLLAFGGTRTYHRLVCAIEDSGFEIRDTIAWMYGTGFPKSHNLDGEYEGWGTALKPAHEPIVLARKPLIGTVAENVAEHGTGALNIDGCRIDTGGEEWSGNKDNSHDEYSGKVYGKFGKQYAKPSHPSGRWPANVTLDEEAARMLDEQSGELRTEHVASHSDRDMWSSGKDVDYSDHEISGGASRFFYCAKASRSERGKGNDHPTVKPVDLMRWLVRLITPPGGTVLDPFMGSGTTGVACTLEGFYFIGIEQNEEYAEIARRRIHNTQPSLFLDMT